MFFGRASSRNTLTCPVCGHEQQEPALAVSTVCRGCGINYRIEKGKAVPPPQGGFAIATRPSEAATSGNEPAQAVTATPARKGPGIRTRSPESLLEGLASHTAPTPLTPPVATQPSLVAEEAVTAAPPAPPVATQPELVAEEAVAAPPPTPPVATQPSIVAEEPVAASAPVTAGLAASPAETPVDENSAEEDAPAPASPSEPAATQSSEPPVSDSPARYRPPARDAAPQTVASSVTGLGKLFRKAPEARVVRCYECGREHPTTPGAESAQCPGCGTYISLRDYEIADRTNRRIQTRGDVNVLKSGAFTGSMIQCHHLTVMGEFSAAVDCSGTFTLRTSNKITGDIVCGSLVIERGVKAEFKGRLEAKSVTIEGEVKGNIACTGKVILEKKAKLEGDVTTAALIVRPGAKHSGSIQIRTSAG